MSRRAFYADLYTEHFEELAAMYDCRRASLNNWGSTHEDLAEMESRMEAHLDGLMLGGKPAMEVVRDQASPADASSYYGLLALACRTDRIDLIEAALSEMGAACADPDTNEEDAAAVRCAAADALCHHLPVRRAGLLVAAVQRADPHVVPVAAATLGLGRHACGEELARAIAGPCADLVPVLRALGRLECVDPRALCDHIADNRPAVAREAALGALRRGQVDGLYALHRAWPAAWAAIPLAMCSGPTFCRRVSDMASDGPPEAMLALGLLGDPAGLDVLLAALRDEHMASAAALGLFLITGGGRVEDPVDRTNRPGDDDDGSEDWLSSAAAGISVDPTEWSRWMQTHRTRLPIGVRHRLGVPSSPSHDFEILAASAFPLQLRRYLADEWVIRYGVRCDFEADMLVGQQVTALARTRATMHKAQLRAEPGGWYFHGQRVH